MSNNTEILIKFNSIPKKDYGEQISYYIGKYHQIRLLPFDQYIQIKFGYLIAIYHQNESEMFQMISDEMISEIINHDDYNNYLKYIYKEIIHLKSKQFIESNNLEKSEHLLRELIKMYPTNMAYRKALEKIFFKKNQTKEKKYFALVVALLLITLGLLYMDIFLFESTKLILNGNLPTIYGITFISSLVIVIAIFLKSYFKARTQVNKIKFTKGI